MYINKCRSVALQAVELPRQRPDHRQVLADGLVCTQLYRSSFDRVPDSAHRIGLRDYLHPVLLVAEGGLRVHAELLVGHGKQLFHRRALEEDAGALVEGCGLDGASEVHQQHLQHEALVAVEELEEAVLAAVGAVVAARLPALRVGTGVVKPLLVESHLLDPDAQSRLDNLALVLSFDFLGQEMDGLCLVFGLGGDAIGGFECGEEVMGEDGGPAGGVELVAILVPFGLEHPEQH